MGLVLGLKQAGILPKEAKATGYTASEMKMGGYSCTEVREAGFTELQDAKESGFTLAEMCAAGYSCQAARAAGYSIKQIKGAGYIGGLKEAGYTCRELKAVGYTFDEIKRAGYVVEGLVALVGPTPQNLQARVLGIFIKREELVNGFPSYTAAGDDSRMMWHANDRWIVGPAANVGEDRGWVAARDGCLRPEASTATWSVTDGDAWLDAPGLHCLAGDSLTAERAKAAHKIALTGLKSQDMQANRLGVYSMRTELVNGYPSYTKDYDTDGNDIMLWHAGQSWLVGLAANLGEDRGWVNVLDGCLRPEASTATWRVYDGDAWLDAPELCVRARHGY